MWEEFGQGRGDPAVHFLRLTQLPWECRVSWGLQALSGLLPMGTNVPIGHWGLRGDFALALAGQAQLLWFLIWGQHPAALSFLARVSGGINWQQGQVGVD